ncbi:FtsX-like permease family protein [Leptolyngbya cf. ectocarpi LEGE 11479]|uniref:FtsX-like permease family protein n=1 Tax=Leptolyngbya cf. ectocarpi LEGE 11479 TaxID=1828722 RepID=A0A929F699_LEPEC|nr:ABC transporter permease DevC [Leptolyngbya ectocarpi]MBE9068060.1 FtsX-like permease family protein [Leptolyngbya cf. ectocarpi LEGE 11479]
MLKRIPLAWLNLTHDRRRFATSLAGVGFAVLLMFMFNGFMNALYDSQLQLLNRFNGEIVIVNRLRTNMFVPRAFARRRLYQARAFEGVQDAYAMYISEVNWKNPENRKSRVVRVIAINPDEPVLNIPAIASHRQALKLPETALMDTQSRAEVGPIEAGIVSELADRRIRLVGTFTMGTDFASGNGNLIMSDQNFLRYFADRGPEEDKRSFATVDIGVVKLAPGTNVERMVKTLRDTLPNDVLVMARDGENGFVIRERKYWQENTNIGFVFSLLTSMGFFVGIILVYQILYTDVADHWAEYATLKAMGYKNGYLLGVVMQEALILSVLGFIPGVLVSQLLYTAAGNATGLFFQMTPERITNLLIATFIMCLVSGAIAVRKVQTTDPADVF